MSKGPAHNPSGYHSKGKTIKDKANNFGMFIKEFGWTGGWKESPETGTITLIATRDNERIEVYWNPPNPWPDEVSYFYGGTKLKLKNVSAAAKLAQETPDADRTRRGFRRRNNGMSVALSSEPVRPVLDYLEDAPEDDIASAIIGDSITWINSLTGDTESDRILPRQFKVTANKDGRTIIHFCGDFGFHAVYLDAVVNIS
jgi:hypothetical protein